MRRPWCSSFPLAAAAAGLACAIALSQGAAPAAGDRPSKEQAAKAAVKEALQHEVYGREAERLKLLEAALLQSPEFGPARWHLGYVKDAKRGWLAHSDFLDVAKLATRVETYERERAAAGDTVEGQLRLAEWCMKNELADQARGHFNRVLDLDPDHAVARARLGFVRQDNRWISREELARDEAAERVRRAALAEWRPEIESARKGLEHKSLARQKAAREKLLAITDPAAIPAIESVFFGAKDEVVMHALEALAAINDPDAALALARIAVWSPSIDVREAAAKQLSGFPQEAYVPTLLASMYTPASTRYLATRLPTGRIGYRHVIAREGQDEQQVVVLDTEYKRIALTAGQGPRFRSKALADAAGQIAERELATAEHNRLSTLFNDRIVSVLKIATREQLPAEPEVWWKWWNEANEVFVGTKPVSVVRDQQRREIEDYVPEEREITGDQSRPQQTGPRGQQPQQVSSSDDGGRAVQSSGGRRLTGDCLAAGTSVWTAKGLVAIEEVQVGDLVLSQHPESGELAYKPVLRTTVRPAGKLIKVVTHDETFETSGGHPFWVSGEGWVKARDLTSGQVLHGAEGPRHVSLVEAGGDAKTYNLVVADFNSYFLGRSKILSHDNTVREPTRAVVPGLRQN